MEERGIVTTALLGMELSHAYSGRTRLGNAYL